VYHDARFGERKVGLYISIEESGFSVTWLFNYGVQ